MALLENFEVEEERILYKNSEIVNIREEDVDWYKFEILLDVISQKKDVINVSDMTDAVDFLIEKVNNVESLLKYEEEQKKMIEKEFERLNKFLEQF